MCQLSIVNILTIYVTTGLLAEFRGLCWETRFLGKGGPKWSEKKTMSASKLVVGAPCKEDAEQIIQAIFFHLGVVIKVTNLVPKSHFN